MSLDIEDLSLPYHALYSHLCGSSVSISRFVREHKRKQKAVYSAVCIQSWWRKRSVRGKYLRFKVAQKSFLRSTVVEPNFYALLQFVRAAKRYRVFLMRKGLHGLQSYAGQVLAKHGKALGVAANLQEEWTLPIYRRFEGVSGGSAALKVGRVLEARRVVALSLLAIRRWLAYTRLRTKRRHDLVTLVRRANALATRNYHKTIVIVWHRYSALMKAERAGSRPPVYSRYEYVHAWALYIVKHDREVYARRASTVMSSRVVQRYYFGLWREHVATLRDLDFACQRAVVFHRDTVNGRVWPVWRTLALQQRAAKWRKGKWFHGMRQEYRRRMLGKVVEERRRYELKLLCVAKWKRFHQYSLMVSMEAVLKLARASPVGALVVYHISQDTERLVFVKCWLRWSRRARRRLVFNKFLLAHLRQRERALLRVAFNALRRHFTSSPSVRSFSRQLLKEYKSTAALQQYFAFRDGGIPENAHDIAAAGRIHLHQVPSRDALLYGDSHGNSLVRKVLERRRVTTSEAKFSWRGDIVFLKKLMAVSRSLEQRGALASTPSPRERRARAMQYMKRLGVMDHSTFRDAVAFTKKILKRARVNRSAALHRDYCLLTNGDVRNAAEDLEGRTAFTQQHDRVRQERRFRFHAPQNKLQGLRRERSSSTGSYSTPWTHEGSDEHSNDDSSLFGWTWDKPDAGGTRNEKVLRAAPLEVMSVYFVEERTETMLYHDASEETSVQRENLMAHGRILQAQIAKAQRPEFSRSANLACGLHTDSKDISKKRGEEKKKNKSMDTSLEHQRALRDHLRSRSSGLLVSSGTHGLDRLQREYEERRARATSRKQQRMGSPSERTVRGPVQPADEAARREALLARREGERSDLLKSKSRQLLLPPLSPVPAGAPPTIPFVAKQDHTQDQVMM